MSDFFVPVLLVAIDVNNLLHGIGGATVTALGGVLIWWLNRKRPSKIVCGILSASPTVTFTHVLGSAVEVIYKGAPAKSLAILELVIFNSGAETINNVEMTLELPKSTTILEINGYSPTGGPLSDGGSIVVSDNKVRFSATYVNSFKAHGDRFRVNLICDGDVKAVDVHGRGPGWSVETRDLEKKPSQLWGTLLQFVGISVLIAPIIIGNAIFPTFPHRTPEPLNTGMLVCFSVVFFLSMIILSALPNILHARQMQKLRA